MKKLIVGAALACALAATPALAGNIVLTGHDNDFHRSTQANAQTLAALTLVRNSSLPVLTFDSGSQLTTQLTALSIPFFNVNPNTAATVTASLFDITRFSAFAVASHQTCGGCDNSSAGLANIAAQSTAIASFFNAGGGIYGLTGGSDLAAYAYVPEAASNAGGSPSANNHFQTADGLALGIPAVNGDATHNFFATPGTGGLSPLFRVVETQGTGVGAIPLTIALVGGTIVCTPTSTAPGCTIVGGTPPTTSVPEPASLAVLAVGMFGLGALRRRRA